MAGFYMKGPVVKMSNTSIRILILLALPSLLAAEKECVQGITYLDPVTGNCDPCHDICDHSREQGTRARCDRLCKGYKGLTTTPPQCPAGHYFDQNVGRCDHCDTICLPPQQHDCTKLCPDWTKVTERTLVSLDQNNYTVDHSPTPARHSGQNSGDSSGSKIHTIILIGIGLLLVVMVAVICFVLRKPLAKRIKEISTRTCNRRGTLEHGGTQTAMLGNDTNDQNGKGPFGHPQDETIV